LEALWELAYNLWFSWNNDITNIFATIDHDLWTACDQNPVELLNRLSQRRIEELARDDFFLQRLADAKRACACPSIPAGWACLRATTSRAQAI
jgi:starch phosphorylase